MKKTENIFIILGYSPLPKNILKDENYNIYLKIAFNFIYSICVKTGGNTVILLCGGNTDTSAPYERTEAGEMLKLFKTLQLRKHTKSFAEKWKIFLETRSISTVENILYAKEFLVKNNLLDARLYIVFDKTREKRIKILSKEVFGNDIMFCPIDFDQSVNRYIDPVVIAKKEALALNGDLKAIQDPVFLKRYMNIFKEKFSILRTVKKSKQKEALNEFWKRASIIE